MHYGLIAIGSRGDVQPFVSLALGLKERNHRVSLIAHENFKEFVESFGLEFKPLTGSVEEILHSPEAKKVIQTGSSITILKYIEKIGRKNQTQINRDIIRGSEQVDVMVSSALAVLWVDVIAEKTNRKWATIQLSFPVTPTDAYPFAGMDYFNFPVFNRFTYWLLLNLYWKFNKQAVNDFRNSLGLPGLKKSAIQKMAEENRPVIYCVSPVLIPRPSDWKENIQITGFLTPLRRNRESNELEQVSEEFCTWLRRGDKPIYIGLGSMPVPDPEKFNEILSSLLKRTTHRFIFCYGWSRLSNAPVSDRLFCLSRVNHEWLFPQCKTAIIHGGSGTLAAVLKAQIPVIITSIFGDQPWWGKLMEKKKSGSISPFIK
jgi:sterol 3beta-glucosyltransferase